MQRRTFLRGVLIGTGAAAAGASTALVRLADAEDLANLTANQPVLLGHPVGNQARQLMDTAVYMRLDGQVQVVGYLTRMDNLAEPNTPAHWQGRAVAAKDVETRLFITFEGVAR